MLAFLFWEGAMEKWIPIFWIIGLGVGLFLFLLFIDFLKGTLKKRPQ